MTPAVILILVIAAILFWFLMAGAFKPIGKLFDKIFEDAIDIITEEDEEEKE